MLIRTLLFSFFLFFGQTQCSFMSVCVAEADKGEGAIFSLVFPTAGKAKRGRSSHLNRIKSFGPLREDLVSWIFAALLCVYQSCQHWSAVFMLELFPSPEAFAKNAPIISQTHGRLECQLINSPFLSFSQVRDGVLRCHQPDMDSPLWWVPPAHPLLIHVFISGFPTGVRALTHRVPSTLCHTWLRMAVGLHTASNNLLTGGGQGVLMR